MPSRAARRLSRPSTPTAPTSAVVTGAARGIGRALAVALVARGHRVVVTDLDEPAARRTAAEIGAAEGLGQDVRDPASHRAVAVAATGHAPLGVWVNNAGVGHDGALAGLSDDEVCRLVEVNLLGVAWGMRAALDGFGPYGGEILNVASLSGLGPVPGLSVYAATKAAVVSLTAATSAEVGRRVRVHAVCPDGVDTALVSGMRPDGRARALIASGGPLLTVEQVADAAVGMLGTRRVLRTLPAWRGAMMRGSAALPGPTLRLEPLMRRAGRRRLRRGAP